MKDLLRALRHQKDATLKEVSSAIGITLSAYSNYEQGLREPSLQILKRICEYFEVSADYFLGLETDTGVKLCTNTPPVPLSSAERELLSIAKNLSPMHRAQVLEYARYFAEREQNIKAQK